MDAVRLQIDAAREDPSGSVWVCHFAPFLGRPGRPGFSAALSDAVHTAELRGDPGMNGRMPLALAIWRILVGVRPNKSANSWVVYVFAMP